MISMRESRLYLDFLKRNIFIFVIFAGISLFINIYQYLRETSDIKVSQSFRVEYTSGNIDQASALADQAVTELRIQKFSNSFPDSGSLIYKSGPFALTIDSVSKSQETGFNLLNKHSQYLKSNFKVSELNNPQVSREEPSILKYLVTGLVLGGLAGLTLSLIRDYFRYY